MSKYPGGPENGTESGCLFQIDNQQATRSGPLSYSVEGFRQWTRNCCFRQLVAAAASRGIVATSTNSFGRYFRVATFRGESTEHRVQANDHRKTGFPGGIRQGDPSSDGAEHAGISVGGGRRSHKRSCRTRVSCRPRFFARARSEGLSIGHSCSVQNAGAEPEPVRRNSWGFKRKRGVYFVRGRGRLFWDCVSFSAGNSGAGAGTRIAAGVVGSRRRSSCRAASRRASRADTGGRTSTDSPSQACECAGDRRGIEPANSGRRLGN